MHQRRCEAVSRSRKVYRVMRASNNHQLGWEMEDWTKKTAEEVFSKVTLSETDGSCLLLPQVILEMPVTAITVSHLRGAVQDCHRNPNYLITAGPVLKDGDTVGPDDATKITVRHLASHFNAQEQVYRLQFGR